MKKHKKSQKKTRSEFSNADGNISNIAGNQKNSGGNRKNSGGNQKNSGGNRKNSGGNRKIKIDGGKVKKILLIMAVSAVIAAFVIPKMIYRINEGLVEQEATVEDIDISAFSEKTFTGSYSSGHMYVNVEVTVVNGQYTDIVMTGYSGINPSRAEKVINSIIRHQTITPDDGDIGEQFTDIMVQKAIYYSIMYNYSVGD
jgi:hypothetical protein